MTALTSSQPSALPASPSRSCHFFPASSALFKVQPPRRIAENLMNDRLPIRAGAGNGHLRPRRGEHSKTIRCANGVNAKEVRFIADHNEPPKSVGPGDHSQSSRRFCCVAALSLGDDRGFRDTSSHQIFAPGAPLGVLVTAITTQRDNQWGNAPV